MKAFVGPSRLCLGIHHFKLLLSSIQLGRVGGQWNSYVVNQSISFGRRS